MLTPSLSPVTVYTRNEALERLAAAEGVGSPFQSALWLGCWLNAMGELENFRLVDLKGPGGRTLLPVLLATRAGVRLARKVGCGHASFFTPVRVGTPEALPPEALKAATQALGVDVMILTDCPSEWAGSACFSAHYPPSPDPARAVTLNPDAPAPTGETAKKLRAKVRKLIALGAGTQTMATPEEANNALNALLGWKAAQFATRGIVDPFGGDEMRRFMLAGLAQGALRLMALMLAGRPIAVLLLAPAGRHASAMTIAYDPATEIARASPGDVLVSQALDILKSEGITGFDLGVGAARYKRQHCPEPIALVDVRAWATLKGAAYAALHAGARRAKGALKRNERLFGALSTLRSRLLRRSAGA